MNSVSLLGGIVCFNKEMFSSGLGFFFFFLWRIIQYAAADDEVGR